jgi:DNA-binding transcriptional MerR regulator
LRLTLPWWETPDSWGMTAAALSIGDFSRATHISVKMLRHYHQVGLLDPVNVDPATGYRRYSVQQVPTAQVIRRFRDLQMPLEQIRAVLEAPDIETRNRLISSHLDALQASLAETQAAVASVRDLLEPSGWDRLPGISHRRVEAVPAAAISEVINIAEAEAWLQGALGELHATLAAHEVEAAGPAGGIYADELFTEEAGEATVFIPSKGKLKATGRVASTVIPPVELATILHSGSHRDIDQAYGALATYVAEHELAVDGPIREYYLVGRHETDDVAAWRTEIGWPVFSTGGMP